MNFLLAVSLFALAFVIGWPTPTSMRVEIAAVQAGSPAEALRLAEAAAALIQIDMQPAEETALV